MKISFNRQLLRFISVFFAVILWFYVLNSEPMTVEKTIAINYDIPAGKAISNTVPHFIKVKVKGPRSFLSHTFTREFVDVVLTKKGKSRRKINVSIAASDIPLVFGVKLISISPKNIEVEMERKILKEVPVKANLVGEISGEYKMVSNKLSRSKVMISGPISAMRKVGKLTTDEIDISRLHTNGKQKVALSLDNPLVKIEDNQELFWEYKVRPTKANFRIDNVPVRFLSSNRTIRSKIRTVSVSVLAPEGVKRFLNQSRVQVVADLPEKKRGLVRVRLEARLPEDFHLLKIDPEIITVRIK